MLHRAWITLSLSSLLLSILGLAWWKHPKGIFPNLPNTPVPVEVTLQPVKNEVTPGERVMLEEVIPVQMNVQVDGINHTGLRIGHYDRQLEKLVNRDASSFSEVSPAKTFDGLPGILRFSHAMYFEIRTPKFKGTRFVFRPTRLGIFLITSEWHLRNQKRTISSNPVVIVVKPPVDRRGAVRVKSEWLAEDDE
jgi:hypothetical protein